MKSRPHPERADRLRAIAASLATAGIFFVANFVFYVSDLIIVELVISPLQAHFAIPYFK